MLEYCVLCRVFATASVRLLGRFACGTRLRLRLLPYRLVLLALILALLRHGRTPNRRSFLWRTPRGKTIMSRTPSTPFIGVARHSGGGSLPMDSVYHYEINMIDSGNRGFEGPHRATWDVGDTDCVVSTINVLEIGVYQSLVVLGKEEGKKEELACHARSMARDC